MKQRGHIRVAELRDEKTRDMHPDMVGPSYLDRGASHRSQLPWSPRRGHWVPAWSHDGGGIHIDFSVLSSLDPYLKDTTEQALEAERL